MAPGCSFLCAKDLAPAFSAGVGDRGEEGHVCGMGYPVPSG